MLTYNYKKYIFKTLIQFSGIYSSKETDVY